MLFKFHLFPFYVAIRKLVMWLALYFYWTSLFYTNDSNV